MSLRKWWNKLISFFSKPKAEKGIKLTRGGVARVREPVGRPPRTPQPRTTIRPSDGGMRKLRRHGKGRGDLSGIRPKKKKGWAEHRKN